jgi:hypothetical protein
VLGDGIEGLRRSLKTLGIVGAGYRHREALLREITSLRRTNEALKGENEVLEGKWRDAEDRGVCLHEQWMISSDAIRNKMWRIEGKNERLKEELKRRDGEAEERFRAELDGLKRKCEELERGHMDVQETEVDGQVCGGVVPRDMSDGLQCGPMILDARTPTLEMDIGIPDDAKTSPSGTSMLVQEPSHGTIESADSKLRSVLQQLQAGPLHTRVDRTTTQGSSTGKRATEMEMRTYFGRFQVLGEGLYELDGENMEGNLDREMVGGEQGQVKMERECEIESEDVEWEFI